MTLENDREAMGNFPLKLIETTGEQALAKWLELKSAAQGSPVVLGGRYGSYSVDDLSRQYGPRKPSLPPLPSVEGILQAAAGVGFPETPAAMERESSGPPLGDWPAAPRRSRGLAVAQDSLTDKPLANVYIGIAPTDDWTTIPAYLRWGGWNACPAPEYHVAALRAWRDRYGAELVGMGFDTIDLRVAAKPETRQEALRLAREHYIYCADLIDQGAGTYSALAADLMADDWWNFWWD